MKGIKSRHAFSFFGFFWQRFPVSLPTTFLLHFISFILPLAFATIDVCSFRCLQFYFFSFLFLLPFYSVLSLLTVPFRSVAFYRSIPFFRFYRSILFFPLVHIHILTFIYCYFLTFLLWLCSSLVCLHFGFVLFCYSILCASVLPLYCVPLSFSVILLLI